MKGYLNRQLKAKEYYLIWWPQDKRKHQRFTDWVMPAKVHQGHFLPTRPAFPHWKFMGLVMSSFMNFRDCTCPWKQLLISELTQLIIINNASRSPRTVSWRRRGAKAIKLVSGTATSSSCQVQILCGNSTHSLRSHCWKAQLLYLIQETVTSSGG